MKNTSVLALAAAALLLTSCAGGSVAPPTAVPQDVQQDQTIQADGLTIESLTGRDAAAGGAPHAYGMTRAFISEGNWTCVAGDTTCTSSVTLSPSFLSSLRCQTRSAVSSTFGSGSDPQLNHPPLISSTSAPLSTRVSHAASGEQASSSVQSVNLLNGMIRAAAVSAKSATAFGPVNVPTLRSDAVTGLGPVFSAAGSGIVGLVINGSPRSNPAPNTQVTLPGVGYVVFNEQIPQQTTLENGSQAGSLRVNMIHVHATSPAGNDLIVGSATSGMVLPPSQTVPQASTYAYTLAKAPSARQLGYASPDCLTPSAMRTVGPSFSAPGITITASDTANVQQTATTGAAHAAASVPTATVAYDSTIGAPPLVTVSNLVVTADASRAGGTAMTFTRSGSATWSSLSINGTPVAAHPDSNTVIQIPRFGYAIVNQQATITNAAGTVADVTGIHLYARVPNPFLPVGAEIMIGHARAGFSPL